MKIQFEFPENWLDDFQLDQFSFLSSTLKDNLRALLREAIVEKAMAQTEVPKIEVSAAEVKERMLLLLAERALEDRE